MLTIRAIDSHTGGEPTRVILEGGIPMEGATMAERRDDFRNRFDHLRSGIVSEPRGSHVLVGAALTPPVTPGALAGVVFFNTATYLGMCGHGTIGVVETLKHLGRIQPGRFTLDTPVGPVEVELRESGEVAVRNVPSRRYISDVTLNVEGLGSVHGDVAYGGNWFFVVHEPAFDLRLANRDELTRQSWRIRHALAKAGITGADGAEIDHIELEGKATEPTSDSRNFVLCPGGAYDRSPCGTGTSAKVACLYADGKLKAGQEYVQESFTGSIFRATVNPVEGGVVPTIVGRAYVMGETSLYFADEDPIRWGLVEERPNS